MRLLGRSVYADHKVGRLRKKFRFRLKFLRTETGQSLVAVIAAVAAALVVTVGILQSNRYFSQSVRGLEENVIFNSWMTLIDTLINGGTSKGPNMTFSCTAALAHNTLNLAGSGIQCTDATVRWPAYCQTAPYQSQRDCELPTGPYAAGTWKYTTYLQKTTSNTPSTMKQAMWIDSVQLCTNLDKAVQVGANRKSYPVELRVIARKDKDVAGSTGASSYAPGGARKLYNAIPLYMTYDSDVAANVECSGVQPTPTPQPSATPANWCSTQSAAAFPTPAADPYNVSLTRPTAGSPMATPATYTYKINANVVNFVAVSSGGSGGNGNATLGGPAGGSGAVLQARYTPTGGGPVCVTVNYACCQNNNNSSVSYLRVDLNYNASASYNLVLLSNGGDHTGDPATPAQSGDPGMTGACKSTPYGTTDCTLATGYNGVGDTAWSDACNGQAASPHGTTSYTDSFSQVTSYGGSGLGGGSGCLTYNVGNPATHTGGAGGGGAKNQLGGAGGNAAVHFWW